MLVAITEYRDPANLTWFTMAFRDWPAQRIQDERALSTACRNPSTPFYGSQFHDEVVLVRPSPIGRTPRSNRTYIKASTHP